MVSKNSREDPRSKFDLDVERMLNEGLAGGQVNPNDSKQIEQAHDIRRNNKPFAQADEDKES